MNLDNEPILKVFFTFPNTNARQGIKTKLSGKTKIKIRNKPDEMFAGHCWSFGVALREGRKGGISMTTSGQKPTPPFLDTGGTGTKADGLTEP